MDIKYDTLSKQELLTIIYKLKLKEQTNEIEKLEYIKEYGFIVDELLQLKDKIKLRQQEEVYSKVHSWIKTLVT